MCRILAASKLSGRRACAAFKERVTVGPGFLQMSSNRSQAESGTTPYGELAHLGVRPGEIEEKRGKGLV